MSNDLPQSPVCAPELLVFAPSTRTSLNFLSATMSTLEPPTVLTRPPPCESPDLPPSPVPSRDPLATPLELPTRCQSPQHDVEGSGSTTPATMSCDPPQLRDANGRLVSMRRKKRRERRESRLRELLKESKLVLTLENSGSVARDHLASERTFLAYARTSLTIASTGVALVQLFTLSAATLDKDLERFARPLGAVMIVLGLFTLSVGVVRYFLIQDALIHGSYPVARISPTILSFALIVLVLTVFIIILVAR